MAKRKRHASKPSTRAKKVKPKKADQRKVSAGRAKKAPKKAASGAANLRKPSARISSGRKVQSAKEKKLRANRLRNKRRRARRLELKLAVEHRRRSAISRLGWETRRERAALLERRRKRAIRAQLESFSRVGDKRRGPEYSLESRLKRYQRRVMVRRDLYGPYGAWKAEEVITEAIDLMRKVDADHTGQTHWSGGFSFIVSTKDTKAGEPIWEDEHIYQAELRTSMDKAIREISGALSNYIHVGRHKGYSGGGAPHYYRLWIRSVIANLYWQKPKRK